MSYLRCLLLPVLLVSVVDAQEKLPTQALVRIGSSAWRSPEANDFAIAPDGKSIAIPSGLREIHFWDATTGETKSTLTGPIAATNLAFTPDGKGLLLRADLDRLQLWDVTTSKAGKEFQRENEILTMPLVSPDGKWLAAVHGDSGKFKKVTVWGVGSGRAFFTAVGDAKTLTGLAIAPDGGALATVGTEGKIILWDPADGTETARLTATPETSFRSYLAFPDARSLVSVTGIDVLRWDLTKKETTSKFRLPATPSAISADGKYLALVRFGKIEIWDTVEQKAAKSIPVELPGFTQVRFAPDSSFLALLTTNGGLRLWNLATGEERSSGSGHSAAITSLQFHPDGKTLLSAGADNSARLWDAATGKEVRTFGQTSQGLQRAVFSPDGKTVAAGGGYGSILLFDTDSGKELRNLKDPGRTFAFSPDGKSLASLTTRRNEETIRLWDVAQGQERFQLAAPPERPGSLLFSPDGMRLALANLATRKASEQQTLLMDAANGKPAGTIEGRALAYSGDGKRLLTLDSDGVQVWDTVKPMRLKAIPIKGLQVQTATWSPDGKTVALAQGSTITLLDGETGKEVSRLIGHSNTIETLAFSADGKRLASGGRDTLIFVWEVK